MRRLEMASRALLLQVTNSSDQTSWLGIGKSSVVVATLCGHSWHVSGCKDAAITVGVKIRMGTTPLQTTRYHALSIEFQANDAKYAARFIPISIL
jgi:hypothetical protein